MQFSEVRLYFYSYKLSLTQHTLFFVHFREFELRVARKTAEHQEDHENEPTRNLLGVLKHVSKTGSVPAIRESVAQKGIVTLY